MPGNRHLCWRNNSWDFAKPLRVRGCRSRIGLCHSSQRTRACTRDGSATVSGRRTRVLQLDIHHAEPDAANIGRNSANCASDLLARRRFQLHVGFLPRFRFDHSRSHRHKSLCDGGHANGGRNRPWRRNGAGKVPLLPARFTPRNHTGIGHGRSQASDRAHGLDRNKWEPVACGIAAGVGFHRFVSGGELDLHRAFQFQATCR